MKPLLFLALLCALPAYAQDTAMPWHSDASFAAYSNTAMSITGDISISSDDEKTVLTTTNGTEIVLHFVEDRSSGWNLSDNDVWPGGVFAVDEDPGELENGNTLCGTQVATYVVFTPFDDRPVGPFLQLAVFSGAAPKNIESAGLCGTLNYGLD